MVVGQDCWFTSLPAARHPFPARENARRKKQAEEQYGKNPRTFGVPQPKSGTPGPTPARQSKQPSHERPARPLLGALNCRRALAARGDLLAAGGLHACAE